MKVWKATYHSQGFIVLSTDGGEVYLDGTMGETQPVSKVMGAESKRSGEGAPLPPVSSRPDRSMPCHTCLREGRDLDVAMGLPNKCTICGGVGKVLVCGKCGGRFRIGGKCNVCQGEGVVQCPDCQGFGELTAGLICKRCEGAGHLTRSGKALK